MNHIHKGCEFRCCFPQSRDFLCPLHRFKKAQVIGSSILDDALHRGPADAPSRHIQNALHRQIIPAVVNGLQIREHVLNLSSGIEIRAAHNVVGHILIDQPLFQNTCLCIGAVKNGKILIGKPSVPAHDISDILCDKGRLFHSCIELAESDLMPLSVITPELFALSFCVVTDYGIGSTQHILGRAIVLLQLHHKSIRINLLIVQDVIDIGAAEFVDRLVIISHHTQVPVTGSQKTDQLELCRVGILILIYHDVAETFLIIR